jgi:diguanylate cyclase (GGDEF)-like protein
MEKIMVLDQTAIQPEAMILNHIVEKNSWIQRIRWIYPFFIILLLLVNRSISTVSIISFREILVVCLLPLAINPLFYWGIKRRISLTDNQKSFKELEFFATLQLDFDFVVLSLFVFFSGGVSSPITGLYIFYIMISAFLISYQKAFRNTLTSIGLIFSIFLLHNQNLVFSNDQTVRMFTFDILLLFSFAISAYLSKNLRYNETLLREILKKTQELSVTDGLTGLYNQSKFFELLDIETHKSEKYGFMYSIILFDVDFFKNFNDHNGHIKGSSTLQKIGSIMKKNFRASDFLAKYGGDEFVVILSQTDKVGSFLASERLREAIEREKFDGGEFQPKGKLTLSLGIASYPDHGKTGEQILDKADQALYFSKKAGRNRTTIYSEFLIDADL